METTAQLRKQYINADIDELCRKVKQLRADKELMAQQYALKIKKSLIKIRKLRQDIEDLEKRGGKDGKGAKNI